MKPEIPAIVAIDGYSSCGKSTFARMIARELGYIYIDTGAMYRAVTLYFMETNMLRNGIIDEHKLNEALNLIHIEFKINEDTGLQETWLNGRNVEEIIRGIEVSSRVSKISQIKEVRAKMVGIQRMIGKNGGVVMDGRDIGTVVFPNAPLKVFMTADVDVRAQRRIKELADKGIPVDPHEIASNIRMRDREDENRQESPLKRAADALILDNSFMTPEQQMDWFREKWNNIFSKDER